MDGWSALHESDVVLNFAEFGIGLAGFASIFLALTRRGGRLARGDAYRVRWMLINSLGAAGLAIVPVTLETLGLRPPLLWQVASGLHVAIMLAGTVPSAFAQFERLEAGDRAQISPFFHVIGWSVASVVLAAQTLNALGFLVGPSAGPYLLSVALMLTLGGMHFVGLLFGRLL